MEPSPLRPSTRLRTRPDLLARDLGGETVILDASECTYFSLNEVGSRIWSLLGEPARLADVHRQLLIEFEVEAEELWRDLRDLIAELVRHGLVEIVPEKDASA